MKPLIAVVIAVVVFIILGLSLFFGLRSLQKRSSDVTPIYSIPKIVGYTSVLQLYLDETSTLDKIELNTKSTDVPELIGYKKFEFTSPKGGRIDQAFLNYSPLRKVTGIFSRATIYTWFNRPMLIIINTVQSESDEEIVKFQYFVDDDKTPISFSEYPIEFDIQDNPVEMQKLLKNINRDMKRLFTLDIGNDLGDDTYISTELNDRKNLTVIKDVFMAKPFVKIAINVDRGLHSKFFQIEELTHNGTLLKIDLPPVKLDNFFVYSWNRNPLLLTFVSGNKYYYYVNKSPDEWIPLLNDLGTKINTELSQERIEKRLKLTILQMFDAFFVDINNIESYDFAGKEVSVVIEKPNPPNKESHVIYKHFVDTGVFMLGACFNNSSYMDMVPLALDLEYLIVHTNYGSPFLIRFAIIENGAKRDLYYSRGSNLKWRIDKNPKKVLDEANKSIFGFRELLSDAIKLDIGKKSDYDCNSASESSKCSQISVKFVEDYGPYRIYIQEPLRSDPGSTDNNNLFNFSSITFNGIPLIGILSGTVSKMRVYFLDDLVPVGIEIISNITYNFINNGNNIWTMYHGSSGKYMLDPLLFQEYSRDVNLFVAFDIGTKVLHTNGTDPPMTATKKYGQFIEHTIQLKEYRQFIFDGLAFRGFWYLFDSASLFRYRFAQIKVYFDHTNQIPLMFELTGRDSFIFYNKFDGRWERLLSFTNDLIPALSSVYTKSYGSISIDHLTNYNIDRTLVTVTSGKYTDKYVTTFHKPDVPTNFNGILYKAYFMRGIVGITNFNALTAYFVAGHHFALAIQLHAQGRLYTFTYGNDDTWTLVDENPNDVAALLDGVYSKFAHMFTKS